jgi:membrane protease YdiL (CAAX protease family)
MPRRTRRGLVSREGTKTVSEASSAPNTRAPETTARRWLRPPVVRLVLMLVVFSGVNVLAGLVVRAAGDIAVLRLLSGVAAAALALWLYAWAVRFTERRSADELRRSAVPAGLPGGTAAGVLLFAVVITVIGLFGGYRITGWGSVGGAVAVLGMMCAAAVTEELIFRGVLLRIVEELTGTWGALAISAVFFGGLHLLNPGATVWGGLAIAVEAGLMLGAAYIATRALWLPIGLHLGWNMAESGIFGSTVSGSTVSGSTVSGSTVSGSTGQGPLGLLRATMSGPDALTGGGFGPEASVVSIVVGLATTVFFLRLARRRGHIMHSSRWPSKKRNNVF